LYIAEQNANLIEELYKLAVVDRSTKLVYCHTILVVKMSLVLQGQRSKCCVFWSPLWSFKLVVKLREPVLSRRLLLYSDCGYICLTYVKFIFIFTLYILM